MHRNVSDALMAYIGSSRVTLPWLHAPVARVAEAAALPDLREGSFAHTNVAAKAVEFIYNYIDLHLEAKGSTSELANFACA